MPYDIKQLNRIDPTPMEKKYYFELNMIAVCVHECMHLCAYTGLFLELSFSKSGGVHDNYTFQCGLVGSFTSPGIDTR